MCFDDTFVQSKVGRASMPIENIGTGVEDALAGLKDFQSATVETVFRRLFKDGQKSMLVADEVGLGKTIVAKGLIAMAMRERMRSGNHVQFKVTYVCSNQIIADENVGKLNIFPEMDLSKNIVRRIAFLAKAPPEEVDPHAASLVLNTLTPGTSFQVSSGTGTRDERAIIYALLCTDPKLEEHRTGLACLLRGTVGMRIDELRDKMEKQRQELRLRGGLAESFCRRIRKRTLKSGEAPLALGLLGISWGDQIPSIYKATHRLAALLRANNEETHRKACNEIARVLRRALIDVCLKYVDADLFILDEFQRFRDLIDLDSHEEEAEIAKRVFWKRKARILLLSATPFKAFTGDLDLANGEDHFRDFGVVLRFLTNGNKAILDKYEQHRRSLYHQLLSLQKGNLDLSSEHREEIERILRSVICRTERQSVATDLGAMIIDKWRNEDIPFGMHDLRNYKATDQIVAALTSAYQDHRHVIGKPVEYCKSAPHPLSYLDGYMLKSLLKQCRRNESVKVALSTNEDAWIDRRRINKYRFVVGHTDGQETAQTCANARLTQLVQESIGANGARLLWIPPSLPYYQLGGAYQDTARFSKVLVFSGWVMVPRMIATLLSYEVERMTIGNPKSHLKRRSEVRRYFPPSNKHNYKRQPLPLLVFRSEGTGTKTAKSMSNFCCLYPCMKLADAYDPMSSFRPTVTVEKIHEELVEKISEMIRRAGLSKYEHRDGPSDRWYWAAPVLLDRADKTVRRNISWWLHDIEFPEDSPSSLDGARTRISKRQHVEMLRKALIDPEHLGLGRLPRDLPQVLADMALGSSAVIALRMLKRLFPPDGKGVMKHYLQGAFEVASEFLNLFNKPESICALRLATEPNDYWHQVLHYCRDGCLQAVMDEYCHLTKGQKGTRNATIAHLLKTINITITNINVDSLSSFMKGRPHKMRCHYAVDFGNQKLETEEGQHRATSIRENFNSPFRPFVLATTSIGQEGLDFHQYCRKIVHWNLPGNPIDLEQREGRINRFKGLVIRQAIAGKYSSQLHLEKDMRDPWESLFSIADRKERTNAHKCELVPYWHVDTEDVKIERIIPMYPFSRDQGKLSTILKTLSIYRLAFGQPRQVELIEYLLKKDFSPAEIEAIRKRLMINLSPIEYSHREFDDTSSLACAGLGM
jgi:Helicase conserved C-terminal domain